jgi:DNA-binding MarR family transcriptional regulator
MLDFFECMRKIQSYIMKTIGPMMREAGFTKTEMFLLMHVHSKKYSRTTDLAKFVDVPASTFTGMVDRLVEKGYLKRVNDLEDRRSVLLYATPHLNETVECLMGAFNKKLEEILEPVPKELIDRAAQDLSEIYALLRKENAS